MWISCRVIFPGAQLDGSHHLLIVFFVFVSSNDPRMVLGLGAYAKVDLLEIHWPVPSTHVDRFTDLPVDPYVCVAEGSGIIL